MSTYVNAYTLLHKDLLKTDPYHSFTEILHDWEALSQEQRLQYQARARDHRRKLSGNPETHNVIFGKLFALFIAAVNRPLSPPIGEGLAAHLKEHAAHHWGERSKNIRRSQIGAPPRPTRYRWKFNVDFGMFMDDVNVGLTPPLDNDFAGHLSDCAYSIWWPLYQEA